MTYQRSGFPVTSDGKIDTSVLPDGLPPGDHAASHKGGGSDAIDSATTSVAGLMASTDKTKLNLYGGNTTSITASGITQGAATQLTTLGNVITAGANGEAVKLPSTTDCPVGETCVIVNRMGSRSTTYSFARVFPNTGEAITNLVANDAHYLTYETVGFYYRESATQWQAWTMPMPVAAQGHSITDSAYFYNQTTFYQGIDCSAVPINASSIASNAVTTAKILDANVTLAKMANLAQDTIIGRSTASTGVPETITCTSAGRALIDDADASAQRTTLGLVIGTNVQAYDADLAAIAGLTSAADKGIQFTGSGTAATYDLTAAGKALLDDADASAQRTTLGLVIGTNVQAYDAELDAIAGLTSAADKLPYFTGSGTAAVTDLTSAARTVLDDTTTAAMLTTLGGVATTDARLGAMATADIILTVTTAGSDSDPARPGFITGGDYSAYPYRQIQAAIDDCARQLVNETVLIEVGAGDFDGFAVRGFVGPSTAVAVRGTWSLATLTTGPNSFTANTGTSATALKRTGGVGWTTNNLRGKFVKVTSGAGYSNALVNEGIGVIISNDADTAVIGGYGIFGLDNTSVVQIVNPGTRIATGSAEPAVAGDAGISVFGNVADVILGRLKIEFTDATVYGLVSSSNGCQLVVQGCSLGSGFHYLATDSYHYWNANYLADGAAVSFDNVRAIASYGLTGGDCIVDASKFTSAIFDYTDIKGAAGNALKVYRGAYALIGLNANTCTATPLVMRNVHNMQVGAGGLTGTNAGTTYFADIAESGQYELAGATGAGSSSDQVLIEGKAISYTTLGAQGTTRRRGSIIHWGSGRERMLQKIYIPVDGSDPGDELATDGDIVVGGRVKHYGQHTLLGGAAGTVAAAGGSQGTATALKYVFSNINSGTGGVILAASGIGSGDGSVIGWGFNRSGAAVNMYPPTGGTINGGVIDTAISIPNLAFFAIASRGSLDFDVTVTLPESSLTLGNLAGTLGISKGGTGQTTQTAAMDALSPTTTKGDLLVDNGTNVIRVAVGTDGHVLKADSGAASGVAWAAETGGGGASVATDTIWDAKGDIAGGTGANTAARLAVGANGKVLMAASGETTGLIWGDAQPLDAELTAIAGLTSAADKGIQFTGSGTAATYDLTAAGKALLDDADASAQRTTLGLAIGTNVQAYDADLAAIAGLTSAADKGIQFTGSGTAGTYDLTTAGKALLDDADATAQRATLGLVIGTNVQAYDADLAAIAALTSAADKVPYATGAGTWALTDLTSAARTVLDDTTVAAMLTTLGGVGGSTGSTDNVLVRADGTGGKTLQSTGIAVDDNDKISGHKANVRAETGTTYTIVASDTGRHITFTNASAITVTVPNTLLEGFQCTWEQGGAGQVTFSGGATVNNRSSHTKSAGQHALGMLSCKSGTGSNAVVTLGGDTGA